LATNPFADDEMRCPDQVFLPVPNSPLLIKTSNRGHLLMHEVALARGLLDRVEEALSSEHVRALRINIMVGSAAGVVASALRLAFGILAEGTRAQGAELSIDLQPARGRCIGCDTLFQFDELIGTCPACGRLGGELLSGNEIILSSIEVADV
jgi:hydrogenase nickel incorporation protein HypA/HybF